MYSSLKALLGISGLWAGCFIIQLILAAIAVAAKGGTNDDWGWGMCEGSEADWGMCEFPNALFVIFTTFHGISFGHIVPFTAGQRFVCTLAALLGYLFVPAALAICLIAKGSKRLFVTAFVTFLVVYLITAGGLGLALAGVHVATPDDEQYRELGFDVSLYYVLMSFHSRPYGEISPASGAHEFITILLGLLSLGTPLSGALAAVGRSKTCRDGGRAFLLVGGVWAFCFLVQLVLAGIAFAAKGEGISAHCDFHDEFDECSFGSTLFLIFTTFHGQAYGHFVPSGLGQRFACILAAILGYLFLPIAYAVCLKVATGRVMPAVIGFVGVYIATAGLASLILAGIHTATWPAQDWHEEKSLDFGTSLYYTLMKFHQRSYGEFVPESGKHEFLAVVSALLCFTPIIAGALRAVATTEALDPIFNVQSPPVVIGQPVATETNTKVEIAGISNP